MGVIKDIKLIESIDQAVGLHSDEKLSVGQRVAAMVINGLGFTDQPLSLVSEFYKDVPIEALFGEGVSSDDFDRFSLSRALDRLHNYGVEALFSNVAATACELSDVNQKVQSFDTTTFSFHGDYNEEYDEGTVKITHGFSKDHRSDLKQVVTELLVSHDSGIPLCLKNCDGNASDSIIFRERSEQLQQAFKDGYVNHVTADSKFYSKENAAHWHLVKFTTRVPETIKEVKSLIQKANEDGDWQECSDGKTRFISYDITHHDIKQRWLVCQSSESLKRGEKSIDKQVLKEKDIIRKETFHFEAKQFDCKSDCEKSAQLIGKKWKLHKKLNVVIIEQAKHDKPGRPSGKEPVGYIYKAKIEWEKDQQAVQAATHRKASFVLATNMAEQDLADEDIVSCYKNQQCVERGYRFLKDPLFFANGFYLKKPSRISALIMIMTLSLLVYTIAQKKLREAMKEQNVKLPNQIGKLVTSLTIRRVFQVLQGIHFIKSGEINAGFVQGVNALQKQIIELINGESLAIYQLDTISTNDPPRHANQLESVAI
jgi:transposase